MPIKAGNLNRSKLIPAVSGNWNQHFEKKKKIGKTTIQQIKYSSSCKTCALFRTYYLSKYKTFGDQHR